jgi:hypothetical protein
MTATLPISPLSLDQLTRDYYGAYDAAAIAQIARLARENCYQIKTYKSPASVDELMAAGAYVQHGLKIAPGTLILGFLLPSNPLTFLPPNFNVQITDTGIQHQFFDEPVPSVFCANYKPVYQDPNLLSCGTFPNLLNAVYPVTGTGLFMVEFWNDPNNAQRVQLVFLCLEAIK